MRRPRQVAVAHRAETTLPACRTGSSSRRPPCAPRTGPRRRPIPSSRSSAPCTTRSRVPIQTVARGVVFGTFAVILGVAAIVLWVILSIRLLDNYLPNAWFGEEHVWVSYLIVGSVLCGAALVLWWLRQPESAKG